MIFIKFLLKIVLLAALVAIREGLGSDILKTWIDHSPLTRSFLTFSIFWLSLNIIIRLTQYIYRKRKRLGHKFSDNVITGLKNIYYLLTVSGVIFMLLGFFGLQPKELLTALSIVAAAVAIISKELVMDVICGINFSFSRDIAIGDYVKIGDCEGRVLDLNIHKIVLQYRNQIINIPNSKAYFSDIVNYSNREFHFFQLEFELKLEQCTRILKMKDVLLEKLKLLMPVDCVKDFHLYIIHIKDDIGTLQAELVLFQLDKSFSVNKIKHIVLTTMLDIR